MTKFLNYLWQLLLSPNTDECEMCGCTCGTKKMHQCPYEGSDTNICNCCDECVKKCTTDKQKENEQS